MRTRVVIQSRLSSSRLPGKALMSIAGMPLVELVARRAAKTGFEVVVATSEESYDGRIAHHLESVGISVVRGALDDVLGRFVDATSDLEPTDRVVRLTGDNPVGDAILVQELIDAMQGSKCRYGRVDVDVVPEGLGVEVFDVELLRAAHGATTDPYDREHVTPWIRRHTEELLFAPAKNPGEPVLYRATVDCLHDYYRVSSLFDDVSDPIAVSWNDLLDRLVKNVTALGAVSRPVPDVERRMTSILLGVANVGVFGGYRDATMLRDTFTHAVDCGVSDVMCSVAEASVVAKGMLPGLKQRMGIVLSLPAAGAGVSAGAETSASIEKVLARTGSPALRAVLVPASDLNDDTKARQILQVVEEYIHRGVVAEFGVLVSQDDTARPQGLPAVRIVASSVAEVADLDVFDGWGDGTRVALVKGATPDTLRAILASGKVHVVVTHPHNERELSASLAQG